MPCHSQRKEYSQLFQLFFILPRRPFAEGNGLVRSKQELEVLIPSQRGDRHSIFHMESGRSRGRHRRFRFFLQSEVQIPMCEAVPQLFPLNTSDPMSGNGSGVKPPRSHHFLKFFHPWPLEVHAQTREGHEQV